MSTQSQLSEIQRLLRNLIRTGVVIDVDAEGALCRVQTGEIQTDWLNWLTRRAGCSRDWWAPSLGEQVVLLAVGGELDTAFVLPGIYCDEFPPPSNSPEAYHIAFPDGAVIEYEPETGALMVTGIKTAEVAASVSVVITSPSVTVTASQKITLDAPEVVCTNKLTVATLEVQKGGVMEGNIEHSGGSFTSNSVMVDKHNHGGVKRGGDNTVGIK
ncbi:TPA: phage baseplate assembly protein V [Yersinia enterocolitica]|nr:phage baseplate assembly protein V [Yersinia enterocolitica]HEN3610852.1 phage baseplate assembly protein V [Yersinia enterocolitica]HEN3643359.1 phage baseplate assembly protein V [Yersinia enterocolitica]